MSGPTVWSQFETQASVPFRFGFNIEYTGFPLKKKNRKKNEWDDMSQLLCYIDKIFYNSI